MAGITELFEFTKIWNEVRERVTQVQNAQAEEKARKEGSKHGWEAAAREKKHAAIMVALEAFAGDESAIASAVTQVDALGLTPEERASAGEEFRALMDRALNDSEAERHNRAKEMERLEAELKANEEEIEADKKRLRRSREALKAYALISQLFEEAMAGDQEAAESLAEISISATLDLFAVSRINPALLQSLASKQTLWPVIAGINSGWKPLADELLTNIGLGSASLYRPLRAELAFDDDMICRRWARRIYEALSLNRERLSGIDQIQKGLKLLECDHTVTVEEIPAWALESVKLLAFDKAHVKAWMIVGRKMIREQLPEFHLLPDWENFRRRHARRGLRTIKGIVQGDILEKIESALTTLAAR